MSSLGLSGSSTSSTQAQKPSLFGSTLPTSQTSTGTLFGGQQSQAQTQQPLGLGSTLGLGQLGQANASSTTVPGVTIDLSNLKSSTRFSDLNDALKNNIIQMENYIQQQFQYCTQISAMMPGHGESIASVAPDVQYLTDRLDAVETALDNDANDIQNVKASIKRDADEAKLSFMAIEQLKLPTQFHTYGSSTLGVSLPQSALGDADASSVDMASYFNSKQGALSEAIAQHERHIQEIESHLHIIEASTNQKARELAELRDRGASGSEQAPARNDALRDLGMTFQAFEAAILNLATKVGETREGLINVTLSNRA